MKLQEIERRLSILNNKKAPTIDKRMLRGGMQERLKRQDIRRYKNDIENQKATLRNKLDLLSTQKDSDFAVMSFSSDKPEEKPFKEPKLKRIRNNRSFFNDW